MSHGYVVYVEEFDNDIWFKTLEEAEKFIKDDSEFDEELGIPSCKYSIYEMVKIK
jgi:hypothetical protein